MSDFSINASGQLVFNNVILANKHNEVNNIISYKVSLVWYNSWWYGYQLYFQGDIGKVIIAEGGACYDLNNMSITKDTKLVNGIWKYVTIINTNISWPNNIRNKFRSEQNYTKVQNTNKNGYDLLSPNLTTKINNIDKSYNICIVFENDMKSYLNTKPGF
jgi:hypothetical protein